MNHIYNRPGSVAALINTPSNPIPAIKTAIIQLMSIGRFVGGYRMRVHRNGKNFPDGF